MSQSAPRLLWLDKARGAAVIAMVVYHFSWNLGHFRFIDPDVMRTGTAIWAARLIAGSFLFLSGLSLALRHSPKPDWAAFWRRFAILAAAAGAVSVVSLFATPAAPIYFGILHCIALAGLIGMLCLRLPAAIIFLIGALVTLAPLLSLKSAAIPDVLLFLGFSLYLPAMSDFVPLVPFAGVLLIGLAIGRSPALPRLQLRLPQGRNRWWLLELIGRWSLVIYLAHQPLLFGAMGLAASMVQHQALSGLEEMVRDCNASCNLNGGEPVACNRACRCMAGELTQNPQLLANPDMAGIARAEIIREAGKLCMKDGPGG